MNQLIQRMAAEAFFDEATSEANDRIYTFNEQKMQKFAELIVESCAQEFDNTYMTGGKTMGAYLREKFGVDNGQ